MRLLRPALVALAVIYIALSAEALEQDGWRGFYQLSTPTKPRDQYGDTDICLRQILHAQDRYSIPDNLLLAIGIQEAGRQVSGTLTVWPWTANADGRGHFFDSKSALEDWVRTTQARGVRSIDVGCMQVNQRWHAQHFANLSESTDPAVNVDYAARYLRQLYAETQDWWEAAGRYHSATPRLKSAYLGKLSKNHKIAKTVQISSVQEPSPEAPQPGLNWTADMTGSGAVSMGSVISIYSNTPLQPILPPYAEVR